jgi:phosphoglycolate phosphatase
MIEPCPAPVGAAHGIITGVHVSAPSNDPRHPRPSSQGLVPAVIFDLDGTLIDTAWDVACALNPILRIHGLPVLDRAQAAALMGHGLRRFAEGAFGLHEKVPGENDLAAFIERYAREPVVHTRPYPDVHETLGQLSAEGWKLLVCTNKLERLATDILQRLDLLVHFDAVCGSDQTPAKKPDPRHLHATLARAGLTGHPAVMVGDFTTDLDAARAFGIPGVFARWGYGPPELAARATAVASRFADLPALLSHLLDAAPEGN